MAEVVMLKPIVYMILSLILDNHETSSDGFETVNHTLAVDCDTGLLYDGRLIVVL